MIKEQFEEITDWQHKTFPNATAMSKLAHLAEELQELYNELAKDDDNEPRVADEFADCFLLLYGCASAWGMDYEEICASISRKMKINKVRKWGKPDEQGVVRHLKPCEETGQHESDDGVTCKHCGARYYHGRPLIIDESTE